MSPSHSDSRATRSRSIRIPFPWGQIFRHAGPRESKFRTVLALRSVYAIAYGTEGKAPLVIHDGALCREEERCATFASPQVSLRFKFQLEHNCPLILGGSPQKLHETGDDDRVPQHRVTRACRGIRTRSASGHFFSASAHSRSRIPLQQRTDPPGSQPPTATTCCTDRPTSMPARGTRSHP